jgi:wyosine [tRNA(Phe)-imidazoG37] synthetase (radical SAM superfamily)
MTRYLFGPVPSRRLGRSLGVDLVPFKTCSYDCIYCQLGPTTCRTIERKAWVPLERVLAELPERLASKPDYITLSGSGEPTLYSQLDELIARIKALTDVPVAVLTNGSLLWQPDLRRQLRQADLVVPSLDAGDEAMFQRVNRPHPELSFATMLDGLVALRQEFPAAYWLEVMVVGGFTNTQAEIEKLAVCVDRIQPERVQLNTVTRPPAEASATTVSAERLGHFAAFFRPVAEVIADFRHVHQQAEFVASRNEVLALLERRPCSVGDIAGGLGMHDNEVVKYLEELRVAGAVECLPGEGKQYYRAVTVHPMAASERLSD